MHFTVHIRCASSKIGETRSGWVCAVKGGTFQWVQAPPGTALAGSNRSSHGGNEVAEAFD